MTDYATEEVSAKTKHVGSLYQQQYIIPPASEGADEFQPKLVSLPGSTPTSVLTHLPATSPEIWGAQGIVTITNYVASHPEGTVTAGTCLAQLNSLEFLDSRNIAISNFGQGICNLFWVNESGSNLETLSSQPQAKSALLTDEVRSFSAKYQISSYLQKALRLARRTFISLEHIEVTPEVDPETDEEWIAISVKVRGEVMQVLDMYDDYTRKFVESVPWPAREKIRLVYDLI